MANKRVVFLILFKIITPALLIAFFATRINITAAVSTAFDIRLLSLGAACLLLFQAIFTNSFKWHLLLPRFSVIRLFKINLISQYYSLMLTGQLAGLVARLIILARGRVKKEEIAASIFVDKITGLIGMLLLGLIGLTFSKSSLPFALHLSLIAMICTLLAAFFCIRLTAFYNFIVRLITFTCSKISRLQRVLYSLLELTTAWHKYSRQVKTILISIVLGLWYQLSAILVFLLLTRSLGINVTFLDWCWILAVLSIALLIPFSIGGLGIREGTLLALLGHMGVKGECTLALSFAFMGLLIIVALTGLILESLRT